MSESANVSVTPSSARTSSAPQAIARAGRWMGVVFLCAGLLGGLLAWPGFEWARNWFRPPAKILAENANPLAASPAQHLRLEKAKARADSFSMMLSHGILGAGVGLMLGAAAGMLRQRSAKAVLLGILCGVVLGAVGGALGSWAGNAAVLLLVDASQFLRGAVPRALAWGVIGLWVGSCAGLGSGRKTPILLGICGGFLGGVLGGFLFELTLDLLGVAGVVFINSVPFVLATSAQRLLSLLFAGGSIGLIAGACCQSARRTNEQRSQEPGGGEGAARVV